jgi:hypothetical protein
VRMEPFGHTETGCPPTRRGKCPVGPSAGGGEFRTVGLELEREEKNKTLRQRGHGEAALCAQRRGGGGGHHGHLRLSSSAPMLSYSALDTHI